MIGEFDGMHVGHRQLVADAATFARRADRALAAVVLVDRSAAELLATADDRCRAVLAAGCAAAGAIDLDSSDREIAAHVIDQVVTAMDPVAAVLACPPGDEPSRYPSLRAELRRRAVEVVEIPRWQNPDGTVITSARIRDAIRAGEIAVAADWLGREVALTGRVVHGAGLGRTIGFATANLELPDGVVVPRRGVYAGHVRLATGERHRSAINIGVRPTVERDGALLVEAHLLDVDLDLYGQVVEVSFGRWLRAEQRFPTLDALVAQLHRDVEHTRLTLRP